MMFKVVTDDGTLLSAGSEKKALTEAQAKQMAGEANRRAEAQGLKTRYKIASNVDTK